MISVDGSTEDSFVPQPSVDPEENSMATVSPVVMDASPVGMEPLPSCDSYNWMILISNSFWKQRNRTPGLQTTSSKPRAQRSENWYRSGTN